VRLNPEGKCRWRSVAVMRLWSGPADAGRGGHNVSLPENCSVHGRRKNKARGQGGSFMSIETAIVCRRPGRSSAFVTPTRGHRRFGPSGCSVHGKGRGKCQYQQRADNEHEPGTHHVP
jgi:hypothetical protein